MTSTTESYARPDMLAETMMVHGQNGSAATICRLNADNSSAIYPTVNGQGRGPWRMAHLPPESSQ